MEKDQKRCTAVIAAAGKGRRLSEDTPKQYMEIMGKPLIVYVLERFEHAVCVDHIILVAPQGDAAYCRENIVDKYGFKKVSAIVEGGDTRQESVFSGLNAVAWDTEIVLVHDGARPFVPEELIQKVCDTAAAAGVCVPGIPVIDTIKLVAGDIAAETLDRDRLVSVQTPQGFLYGLLLEAHQKAAAEGITGTDDSSLTEWMGIKTHVVEGSSTNIKITTALDLVLAKEMAGHFIAEDQDSPTPVNGVKSLEIYTDGACSGNPGPGGYGVVILYNGQRKELSGGYALTTNNRMEILAVIKGLEALKEPCSVKLYSDSKYVVDAVEKGWAKKWRANGWMRTKSEKALNTDLWDTLLGLLEIHEVRFYWVKGHASNAENNRCDELARNAVTKGDLLQDSNYYKNK